MPFGKVLLMLRKRAGLTQNALASVLGVSESRIGMYERGKREPDFEMLEAIADYFNVDMDFLTGRSSIERQYSFDPVDGEWILTYNEQQLIRNYRDLNQEGKEKLLDYSEDLVSGGRYKKAEPNASNG